MSIEGELLTPGGMFGDFKVLRELGKGGMGAVYLVENAEGAQFAVKIVDPKLADKSKEFVSRFTREGNFAKDLDHPNLITVHDMGQDPDSGYCYLVMDYLPGGDVHQRLSEIGRFPVDEAAHVIAQVANALVVAHARGVVHRDIKPGNIMFDAKGVPHLADLGVAKFSDAESSVLTSAGMMIGTPAYMAPEQIMDSHTVDARADIYSLGIVLFEMLAGKRPNEGDSVMGIVAKAVKGDPIPDIRTLRPEVPDALAQLLNMMCAPKRDDRIESASEVVAIFTRYFNRTHTPAPAGAPPPFRTRSRVRRPDGSDASAPQSRLHAFFARRKIPLISAAAVLVVAIFAAVHFSGKTVGRRDLTPPPPVDTNAVATTTDSAPDTVVAPQPPPIHPYMVVDLSGGTNAVAYPVTYLDQVPAGGWTDEYKTTKLVLRRIEAGTFQMGPTNQSHQVTLTHPFYIGVFEVTQKQYELVTGLCPCQYKGAMRPVDKVSYNMVRGKNLGDRWPTTDEVDGDSFLGKFRARSGLKFDLPTEAQWEYACHAGTREGFKDDVEFEKMLFRTARFALDQKIKGWQDNRLADHRPDGKGGSSECTTVVGAYDSNNWGIYDMYGNVWEWCLDRWENAPLETTVDPLGGPRDSVQRIRKGGSWDSMPWFCRGYHHDRLLSVDRAHANWGAYGFRVVYTLESESPNAKLKAGTSRSVTLPGGEKYEMVWCPPCPEGFMMGSPANEKGRNADERLHRVRLTRGFWIGKYELTQKQWLDVMGRNPSQSKDKDGRLPVERVTLNECRHFLLKIGSALRLPTEAEWEYACRSGDAWGIRDMQGSVAEWVADFYAEYPQEEFNPTGTHFATNRVARGGWKSTPDECRPAARWALGPDTRYANVGVRLAMDESMQDVAGASSLLVQAAQGGKALANAKLWLGAQSVVLPYAVEGLNRGMFTEPYVVTCEVDGKHYEGNVPPMPVDWTGVRTNVVELVPVKDEVQQRAGKTKSFDLGGGVPPLAFVYCPPGKFMMHEDEDCHYDRHEVEISRPFWIMKYKLTRDQIKFRFPQFDLGYERSAEAQMLGGAQMPLIRGRRHDMLQYCKELTNRYKDKLPPGYVVRFPTEAEWEYAYHAAIKDVQDPYCANSANRTVSMISFTEDEYKRQNAGWGCPLDGRLAPNFGGLKLPNRWGLHDMASGEESVWDTWPAFNAHKVKEPQINVLFNYRTREVDPVRTSTAHAFGMFRNRVAPVPWDDGTWLSYYQWVKAKSFRLVIGPEKLNRIELVWKYPEIENRKAGTTKTVTLPGGAKLELVWCPPCPNGFMMGSPKDEEGRGEDEVQHEVVLTRGFWIGKYEVTQEQWKSVMGNEPSSFKGVNMPVENVSWNDCNDFCNKVKWLRLPTEAEWEYACRARTTGAYAGDLEKMAWYGKAHGGTPRSVGKKKANAWGIYDMHGNVYEWCRDWYADYRKGKVEDPTGPTSGDKRVSGRGGCFAYPRIRCRSASRFGRAPDARSNSLGFRVVCTAEPVE